MEQIKFLLINAGFQAIDGVYPGLGLCYIASSLLQDKSREYIFRMVSGNYENEIKTFQPDIIGITSVSKNYNVAKECARLANIPVIIGGVHISMVPQSMTEDMDVAIIGEGEQTIKQVMNAFSGGKFDKQQLKTIPGIVYQDNGVYYTNNPRELINDLDSIPYPARDLIEIKAAAHMLTGRGCPFHCSFCSTSRYTHNRLRQHSAEYVVGEIQQIYQRYKVGYITIYDDLFAVNTKRVTEIQDRLRSKGLLGKIGYGLCMRADMVTEEVAQVFRQMGVVTIGIGLESGCARSLEYLKGKGSKLSDNEKAIRILQKYHIRVYGSFIIGLPDEDKREVEETIQFIQKNKLRHFDVGILTPFPGTPVWEYARTRNLVSEDMDWSRLDFRIHNDPVYLSQKISKAEMAEIDQRIKTIKRRNEYLSLPEDFISHPVFFPRLAVRMKLGL